MPKWREPSSAEGQTRFHRRAGVWPDTQHSARHLEDGWIDGQMTYKHKESLARERTEQRHARQTGSIGTEHYGSTVNLRLVAQCDHSMGKLTVTVVASIC